MIELLLYAVLGLWCRDATNSVMVRHSGHSVTLPITQRTDSRIFRPEIGRLLFTATGRGFLTCFVQITIHRQWRARLAQINMEQPGNVNAKPEQQVSRGQWLRMLDSNVDLIRIHRRGRNVQSLRPCSTLEVVNPTPMPNSP